MRRASHPVSLRQLQYAAAIEDLRSFRKAAEACHVSQPALSAQVARLERVLGVRLFERDRRRVLVTPAGVTLLARTREVLLRADDLLAEAARQGDPLAGRLRLGVIPTISPYLLPELTPVLRRELPRLEVAWVEDRTGPLAARLAAGDLDAALLALEADLGDLEREALGCDPFLLAAAPGHPLAAERAPARAENLAGGDLLLLEDGHCLRGQALSFCAAAGPREAAVRATSLPTLVQMVAAGLGVTLLPRLAVPVEGRRGSLVLRPFAEPAPGRTLGLVFRRGAPLVPGLRRLAAVVKEVLLRLEPRLEAAVAGLAPHVPPPQGAGSGRGGIRPAGRRGKLARGRSLGRRS
jgi:LysR family hydrogen peroxide-inducible transcriptional activator